VCWLRCRGAVGRLGAVVLAVAVLAVAAPAGAVDGFTPGSPGLGDPFFPLAGNGGYDVTNYGLRLGYDPATNHLDGTATIRATATQNLSRFDLDLRGFQISRAASRPTISSRPSTTRRRRTRPSGRRPPAIRGRRSCCSTGRSMTGVP
jgi:hypothetical protein